MGLLNQYATEKPADPVELRVYAGVDGHSALHEDGNDGYRYEQGEFSEIPFFRNMIMIDEQ